MPSTPPIRPYRWLAEYYDLLFGMYENGFDPAREAILGPVLRSIETACDLACGTGRTMLLFWRQGIRAEGVDLSPTMCRLARAKLRKEGFPAQVRCADMRRFRLARRVDLVTCEYDALNHVPEKSDLRRVARNVAQALKPDGWFFFDVNTRLAFENNWSHTWMVEKPGVVMVMHGDYAPGEDRAWTNVDWFLRDKTNRWRRHREYVEEVCWSDREIRTALKEAGFASVRAVDAAPFFQSPFFQRGYRTFYLARKAER